MYTVTWLSEQAGLATEDSLEINTISLLAAVFMFIGAGMLADRWNAVPGMRVGLILAILAAFPIYLGISSGSCDSATVGKPQSASCWKNSC